MNITRNRLTRSALLLLMLAAVACGGSDDATDSADERASIAETSLAEVVSEQPVDEVSSSDAQDDADTSSTDSPEPCEGLEPAEAAACSLPTVRSEVEAAGLDLDDLILRLDRSSTTPFEADGELFNAGVDVGHLPGFRGDISHGTTCNDLPEDEQLDCIIQEALPDLLEESADSGDYRSMIIEIFESGEMSRNDIALLIHDFSDGVRYRDYDFFADIDLTAAVQSIESGRAIIAQADD